ncbi:hypothetical protein Tco_1008520, partial [Tanacetum coccineum]
DEVRIKYGDIPNAPLFMSKMGIQRKIDEVVQRENLHLWHLHAPDYGGPVVAYADGVFDKRLNRYITVREGTSLKIKIVISGDLLSFRMNNPLVVLKPQLTFDLDIPNTPKGTIYRTAMLLLLEKPPRSTTWVPSDRYSNKLMAEDHLITRKPRTDNTYGRVPNTLVIANGDVVKPKVAAAEHIS